MIADLPPMSDSRHSSGAAVHRPAVFLDRDGTLIEDVDYLSDPGDIRFIPNAVDALKRLRRSGFACVIVTNQSGIGRGMITHEQLEEIHAELLRLLGEQDTTLDGIYYSPEAPLGGPEYVIEHNDRKPGPGMLMKAAAELDLDLASSWMIGDKISDVLAGFNAGCRGSIRLRTGKGRFAEANLPQFPDFPIVEDLAAAAAFILGTDPPPANRI
jgi:D-glycero-D-manno-heptose 1,7-bisphosphate phosphatase